MRVFQERQGLLAVLGRHRGLFRRLQRFLDLPLLQFFELAQYLAQVVTDHILGDVQLARRQSNKPAACAHAVEVQGINVEGLAAAHQQVDLHQHIEGKVFGKPPDTIASIAQHDHDLFIAYLRLDLGRRHRRQRRGRQHSVQ